MKEQIITFETAKLAKEKRFNIPVQKFWLFKNVQQKSDPKLNSVGNELKNSDWNSYESKMRYSAPTQSLLQKWLREKHFIQLSVDVNSGNEGDEDIKWFYSYTSRYDNSLHEDAFHCAVDKIFNSYEEALEEALRSGLELIWN